jgi:formiminotetrahydrofolate cyclodeaminase
LENSNNRAFAHLNLKSDLQTAVAMAHAAIRGALVNVAINLKSIKDEAFSKELNR